MTVVVLVRHEDTYILAADGCAVSGTTKVNSEITKIHKHNRFDMGMAGSCGGLVVAKWLLNQVPKHTTQLDVELFKVGNKTDKQVNINDETDFLVLNSRPDGLIQDAILLGISSKGIHVENLRDLNHPVEAIGSGSDSFLSAYQTLKRMAGKDWEGRTLSQVVEDIKYALSVVDDLDIYCNDNITVKTFKAI